MTFMYEEDRQTALAMYSRMFDEADDVQALLLQLVSPTRQAVVVARAYNAKERKLQVRSQSRGEDGYAASEETPDFVQAIASIHENALSHPPVYEKPADQFSLFADDETPAQNTAAPAAPAVSQPVITPAAPAVPAKAAEAPQTAPEAEQPVPADDVDDFIANFSITDQVLAPTPEEPAEEASDEAVEEAPVLSDPVELEDIGETPGGEEIFSAPRRRPKVFLLILFIILALPITLLGVLLLLIPTILFLALAVSVIGSGSAVLIASFSGFAVFADILVMLGAALVILALGLLFLWLFIWFIGGAIAGLIRGVIQLGGKWCYKEVPAV